MSCACREGYNLFQKSGRYSFMKNKAFKYRSLLKLTFQDTFIPIICMFVGHKGYDCSDEKDGSDWACKRCGQFITFPDPVRLCPVYRNLGCRFVDGMDCNMRECLTLKEYLRCVKFRTGGGL